MLISIIANSKRHDFLANMLGKDGHQVIHHTTLKDIPDRIFGQLIILPIPTTRPDGSLNIDGNTSGIKADEIVSRTDENATIIGCNYATDMRHFIDINTFEPFCFMNAVPSAEGAILTAMQNCNTTLYQSKCLVIGYGRIGKLIADRMSAFCADTSITARNPKDIYLARSLGHSVLKYENLADSIYQFDIIFQTVPKLILDRHILSKTKNDCVIIELASKGVGTDLDFAKDSGLNVIYAPAIPEKYSPISAGKIFYDSVINILDEFDI